MKKILFKNEEHKSTKEVAQSLRQIADKLEEGSVTFKKGTKEISLEIPQNVEFEIKVDEKHKGEVKKSLEIEIEWKEGAGKETVIA